MIRKLKFIIPDCYTKESRLEYDHHYVTYAGKLYADLLKKYLPDAEYDIFYSSDPGITLPCGNEVTSYTAVIWPGCNLTVYHRDDQRVQKLIALAEDAYEYGLPQFGSCWAIQMAAYAAGGDVGPNPKGREMGVARKIHPTEEGKIHPLLEGKPPIFDGFVSHDDIVIKMPEGGVILAGNEFTPIQAVEVKHKKGVFWATQYHPELNLKEMAHLIAVRENILTKQGYFNNHEDMIRYTEDLEAIYNDPSRKDLRWKYDIDDTIISDKIREREFTNWINKLVLPSLA